MIYFYIILVMLAIIGTHCEYMRKEKYGTDNQRKN